MKPLLLIAVLAFSPFCHGQELRLEGADALSDILERYASLEEVENLDPTTALEALQTFGEHPLDLNRASRDDLRQLRILSDFQIEQILDHRSLTGRFLHVLELQGIASINAALARTLTRFVQVGKGTGLKHVTWKKVQAEGKHQLLMRVGRILEPQQGYKPQIRPDESASASSFIGNPMRVFMRYRFRYGDKISLGWLVEKDPGERIGWNQEVNGFGMQSAHFSINDLGRLSRIVIGDFQAQFGQGLTSWSGYHFAGVGVYGAMRSARGLVPYSSANENAFLRGVGVNLDLRGLDISLYLSRNGMDATLDTVDQSIQYVSLSRTGIHATPAQMLRKDAIVVHKGGAHLNFSPQRRLKLGSSFDFTHLSAEPSESVSGGFRHLTSYGIDHRWAFRNFLLFGEQTVQSLLGRAHLNGAIVTLNAQLEMSLVHRIANRAYRSGILQLSKQSLPRAGEEGIEMRITVKPARKWTALCRVDVHRNSGVLYRIDAPSMGQSWFLQLQHVPARQWSFDLRFSSRSGERNASDIEAVIEPILSIQKDQIRFHVRWQLTEYFLWQSRVAYSRFRDEDTSYGWLLYQDLRFSPTESTRVSLSMRYTVFDTDDFDARLYAYESDVSSVYSTPALAGIGSRWYAVIRWKPKRWLSIQAKLSQTYFSDRKTVGTGNYESPGPRRTEGRLEVKFRL